MSDETNEPSVQEQRVNAAIAAYLEAMDAGKTPDPQEFIAAHSDIAADLEGFFANRDDFERMVKPLQPAAPAGAPGTQYDEATPPPAGELTEAPTLAPTKTADPAVVAKLTGHAGSVTSLAFSPDGNTLASAGEDGTVRLWDLATAEPKGTLVGRSCIRSIAFSPNGKILASASDDEVRLWRAATDEEVQSDIQKR